MNLTDADLIIIHSTLSAARYLGDLRNDPSWTVDADRSIAAVERALGWDEDEYANGCGVCGCCPCRKPECEDCNPPIPEGRPNQCRAVAWERAADDWTRCRLNVGHRGSHDDGCLVWFNEDDDGVPDTGPFGYHAPMVHGVSGARAIVTRCVAKQRSRHPYTADVRDKKRQAHRRHRRAWRVWARDPERSEPRLRPLSSWDVW